MAQQRVMIVGGGAQRASAEVTALAQKLKVGVIASNAGTFDVEDVLHPEITGHVVVFTP